MLDLFLCHSEAGRDVANTIASRLEECADAKVWREDNSPGSNVMDAWEGGLSAAGILLVLDPGVTPRNSSRTEWGPLLEHVSENAQPPIACIRAEASQVPVVARAEESLRLAGTFDAGAAVNRAVGHQPARPRSRKTVLPIRLPRFSGREHAMDELWRSLVDRAGSAVTIRASDMSGKTALAQEFGALRDHVRDVLDRMQRSASSGDCCRTGVTTGWRDTRCCSGRPRGAQAACRAG